MTISQFAMLESAGDDGQLTWTDQRVVKGLVRRGWVREHTPTRRGRRKRSQWYVTEAGRAATENQPEIIPMRPRPHWRAHWQVERVSVGRYLVDGHEIVRPARGMLWRVNCPRVSSKSPLFLVN